MAGAYFGGRGAGRRRGTAAIAVLAGSAGVTVMVMGATTTGAHITFCTVFLIT